MRTLQLSKVADSGAKATRRSRAARMPIASSRLILLCVAGMTLDVVIWPPPADSLNESNGSLLTIHQRLFLHTHIYLHIVIDWEPMQNVPGEQRKLHLLITNGFVLVVHTDAGS